MKKIIQRKCISCNLKKDKRELLRLVLNKQGEFFIDDTGKAEGRGIYICKNIDCLENTIKNKKLEKLFGIKIKDELYENIRRIILKEEVKNNKNLVNGGELNG